MFLHNIDHGILESMWKWSRSFVRHGWRGGGPN